MKKKTDDYDQSTRIYSDLEQTTCKVSKISEFYWRKSFAHKVHTYCTWHAENWLSSRVKRLNKYIGKKEIRFSHAHLQNQTSAKFQKDREKRRRCCSHIAPTHCIWHAENWLSCKKKIKKNIQTTRTSTEHEQNICNVSKRLEYNYCRRCSDHKVPTCRELTKLTSWKQIQ